MKTRIAIVAFVALATSGLANAQDEGRPERPQRGGRQLPPELVKQFDKDGDGKLSDEEAQAAREARRAEMEKQREKMLAEFDTDKDGKLSEDERKAMGEAMKAKREALLAKYDENKDGRLSPEERQAAIDAGEDMPRGFGQRGARGEGGAGPRGPRGEGGPGPRGPRGEGGPAEGGDAPAGE